MMNVVIAFFLLVFTFGLFIFMYSGYSIYQHAQSLSWQQTNIRKLDLDAQNRDNLPRQLGQLAHRTSRVAAQYEYHFNGQYYTSRQLSFFSERSYGLDDWDQKILQRLSTNENTNQIFAWVNPVNPSESVVVREIRWAMFAIYFFVGLFLMAASAAFIWGSPQNTVPVTVSVLPVFMVTVFSMYCLVVTYFLYKDGHTVWAIVSFLPTLIAVNGIVGLLKR